MGVGWRELKEKVRAEQSRAREGRETYDWPVLVASAEWLIPLLMWLVPVMSALAPHPSFQITCWAFTQGRPKRCLNLTALHGRVGSCIVDFLCSTVPG